MLALILATMLQSAGGADASQSLPQSRSKADRQICRVTELTGSRMARGRVCKSASEWQVDRQAAEKYLTGKQNLNLEDPPPSPLAPPPPQ